MLKIVGRNAKEMLMNRITEGLTAVGFEKSELDKAGPGGHAQFRSFPSSLPPGLDRLTSPRCPSKCFLGPF